MTVPLRTARFLTLLAATGYALTLVAHVTADNGATLDQQLDATLAQHGFTGRIESTLEDRLGHRIDNQLADLGRLLWFDTVTGLNNDNNCSGCHSPANGFGDTQSIAIGVENNGIVGPNRAGPRNQRRTPMVINSAFFPNLMWNSRFASLANDPFDNSAGFAFPPPEGLTLSHLPHLLHAQAFIPPTERVEVAGFAFPGDNVDIRAEVLSRINAVPEYRKRFGKLFPPIANLDPTRRFAMADRSIANQGQPPVRTDVSGVWRMTFAQFGTAKGTFEQETSGVVRGTIEVPSDYGDLRFLAGNVHDSEISLSTFDGRNGYVVRARLGAGGLMQGELLSSEGVRDAFSAERSEDFDTVDPLRQVQVTSAARRLDFAPLLAPRYAGKAVILEVFGTWCSNCNDLAPLLTELYREHHEAGLEMLGVAFEISNDESFNRERLAAYRAKHGLDWEVIAASVSPDEAFSAGPAKLSSIAGVPVTIFLNRDRTIHAIYTGFRGPATGATHLATVATFRRLTREILQSAPRQSW